MVVAFAAMHSCTDFQEEEVPVSFGVDAKEVSFSATSSTCLVTVSSGTKWDVTHMPSWISLGTISRSRQSPYEWTVNFSATANEEYNREGTIVIKAGSETAEISVTQEGKKGKYIAVESVSLTPTELTLTEGDNTTLSYSVSPSNASVKDVTWTTSASSVATVSNNGRVDAVAEGTALITVKTSDGNKTASCAVTVKAKVISVTGVSLDKTSLTLTEGDVQELIATVTPSDATNKSVTWTSSNSSVASVSSAGVVAAKTAGSTTITVKTSDGSKTATCAVTVKAKTIAVTGVSLDKTSLTMTVGDTQSLVATVTPSNATNKSVTWSSNNTSVATVSSSGVVTAKATGSATITVTTNDGGKKATCTVTVQAQIVSVTGVSLNKTSLTMTVGDTQTLTATVTPSNATDKSVTWSSSNTSVATVSSSGVVTAIAAGSATITVTTNDGGKKATCTAVVQAQTVSVTGVTLDKTSMTLTEGDTYTLTATISPSNATDKSVTWSSSNTSVATVSSSGVVTAKAIGTATITVTTNDGGKKATCAVSVISAWSIDGSESGHEYVDLGLPSGLKWATCNLGASKSEDYGGYYAWGETSTKNDYSWTNYKFRTSGSDEGNVKFSKYNSNSGRGTVDNKFILDLSDDAARVNWGGTWRMPTKDDFEELKSNCTCTWITKNGINGYKITSKNNNKSIFLPAAGRWYESSLDDVGEKGSYWTSSLYSAYQYPFYAYFFLFNSSYLTSNYHYRCQGRPVRPVFETNSISVTGVSLNKTSLSMTEGDTYTLTATVSPSNATDKSVTWSSSNTSVATVSSSGVVTAKSQGSATITVKTNDGAKKATCSVTVKAKTISVTGVSLNMTSLTLTEGETQTLTATVSPSNATDKSVTWSSSNTSVATVSSSGVVSAKSAGSATITVTTNDGGKKATCAVTVKAKVVNVAGVSLNCTSLSMEIGATNTLVATVLPSDATNKSVTWSSNNSFVAEVSSSGVVTAKAVGSAVITVTTIDGGKTAICNVTVTSSEITPEAVDLGLPSGVKWASFNLGATSSTEYGDYYAWGETETYYNSLKPLTWKNGKESGYIWSSYKWGNSATSLTKYNTDSSFGSVDNKTTLDLEDDAARVRLGGTWRMPTYEEYRELLDNCTCKWGYMNSVKGIIVTSKTNGNRIFFPSAGCYHDITFNAEGLRCRYWSATLNPDSPSHAWYLYGDASEINMNNNSETYFRFGGLSIRPVMK